MHFSLTLDLHWSIPVFMYVFAGLLKLTNRIGSYTRTWGIKTSVKFESLTFSAGIRSFIFVEILVSVISTKKEIPQKRVIPKYYLTSQIKNHSNPQYCVWVKGVFLYNVRKIHKMLLYFFKQFEHFTLDHISFINEINILFRFIRLKITFTFS